jgi:hypothetical protein
MAKKKTTPTPIPQNATAYGHPMHPAATPGPVKKGVLRPLTAPSPGTFAGTASGATPPPYDPSVDEAAIIGGRNVAITNGNAAYDTGNLSFDYGIQSGQLAAYANAGSGVSGADFSALLKSVYPSGG